MGNVTRGATSLDWFILDGAVVEVGGSDLFSWSGDDENDTLIEILGRLSSAEVDFTLIIGRLEVEDILEERILCFPSVFFVFFVSDEVLPEK